mgnify:CR=1 FL=1
MNDDSLWDPSLPNDPEVERLERALAPLAWSGKGSPALPDRAVPRRRSWRIAAAAGIVLAATAGAAWLWTRSRTVPEANPIAPIEVVERSTIRPGQVVATDGSSRAYLDMPGVGHVEVAPGTTLSVRESAPDRHELYLERGSIRALVTAPPRLFQVGTPSGLAVDLGCLYTLTVDEAGDTVLEVELGQVSMEAPGRAVLVPGGAVCRSYRDRGPGTPYWRESAGRIEAAASGFDRGGDVAPLLAALDAADTPTFLALLAHESEDVRGRAWDRLVAFVEAPPGAGRLDRRPETLEAWTRRLRLDW